MNTKYIGAIAQIYEGYTHFVLNKGKVDGISEDDHFIILELGNEVIDPESGEHLGTLEIVKGKVRVFHLQEKMATLISDEFITETPKEEYVFKTNPFTQRNWTKSLNTFGWATTSGIPTSKIVSEPTKKIKELTNVKIGDKVKITRY